MAVVIGMSIYVVHYKEFRFGVNGSDFSSSNANLKYAPRCSSGDTEIFSDYQPRWEYSSCSCRWRWWNCGDGKAKHIRACQEPNGDRYNLAYETCQTIPSGASPNKYN